MNIDSSLVGTGDFRAGILILKVQLCVHLQTGCKPELWHLEILNQIEFEACRFDTRLRMKLETLCNITFHVHSRIFKELIAPYPNDVRDVLYAKPTLLFL